MSKELGVGVRVFVGWCADEACGNGGQLSKLQCGTISGGPYFAGHIAPGRVLVREIDAPPKWKVRMDNSRRILASEFLLAPIDDSDESTETEREKEEVTE